MSRKRQGEIDSKSAIADEKQAYFIMQKEREPATSKDMFVNQLKLLIRQRTRYSQRMWKQILQNPARKFLGPSPVAQVCFDRTCVETEKSGNMHKLPQLATRDCRAGSKNARVEGKILVHAYR